MILLIDWGNTFLKYIIVDGAVIDGTVIDGIRELEPQLNLGKVKQVNSLDCLEKELAEYKNKLSTVYISSVRKQSDNLRLSKVLEKFGVDCVFVKTESVFGKISCAYEQFEKLGVDRWLTIIGSYHSKMTTGIIDIGSAITLDVVNKNGQHLGGHIVPGYKLLLKSLKATDGVLVSEKIKNEDKNLLGKSTSECVNYGIEQMLKGYLESSISAVTREHHVDRWIFTGGGGEYWSQNLSVSKSNNYIYDNVLIFKGLIKYLNG